MMRRLFIFMLTVAWVWCARCEDFQPHELPLPVVPDSLKTPSERADFVMLHFWDALDFSDNALMEDDAFMGQNFANFISLFPYASEMGTELSLTGFLQSAMVSDKAMQTLMKLAEWYLLGKDSPVHNESLFLAIADKMEQLNYPDMDRIKWFATMTRNNAPGSEAPDFTFIDMADGKSKNFRDVQKEVFTVLVFYNPDCRDCHELIDRLHASAVISRRIADHSLMVIGIYIDGDREEWLRYSLPIPFVTGFDLGSISDDELYVVPANPTLYLISPDGKILLKDASFPQLEDYLTPKP